MNAPMLPLVVVFAGAAPTTTKMASNFRRRLARRGLRKEDIVVLTSRADDVQWLTAQVERRWTQCWLAWYARTGPSRSR